ncbi:ribonuclease H-like protein [Microstroma glucosiphilum]|uniref:ribonuclease H n=1 Tax=Pseudomicrostroma glucosiphilum TaxID=1684307 RepID=A0A316U2Z7_9BASI|nr:ribonuclease H-like protein [Pseudomicrostroma glucosiphilum]PWN19617.1 ribonuclease H-like protein [Pseudomicrostroma glucosiphilum]
MAVRPIRNLMHLSAADIYRAVTLADRMRTVGPEWIATDNSYARLDLPQVDVYCSGICSAGTYGHTVAAGWGVYFDEQEFRYLNGGGPVTGRRTKYRAELMAIYHTLVKIPPDHHVVIYTESFHVLDCFYVWFDYWEVHGYFNVDGSRVDNRSLIQDIMRERRLHRGKVELQHVTMPYERPGVMIAERIASNAARDCARSHVY